ncbi:hypothetical protein [Achromobacter insuavis]|uniref:hypothetical protein n=1 Tax=Achromobacter insuavis TaxID=1287735 RepID=UPI001EEC7E0A|nr:hypothetical protein [Achromobacter insuavis]
MTISSVTPSSPFVSLEAFAKAAESGQDVYVDVAGEKLQVLGMGTTPGGRSVAWVAPNVDTTAMFAQALDMAQTSRDALSGVDFLTRLALSATNGAPAFQQACSDAGVAPASLDAARRGALDQAMQARFDQAAQSGQSPVSLGTAAAWLRDLLKAG